MIELQMSIYVEHVTDDMHPKPSGSLVDLILKSWIYATILFDMIAMVMDAMKTVRKI
jgi:hypothetical protein